MTSVIFDLCPFIVLSIFFAYTNTCWAPSVCSKFIYMGLAFHVCSLSTYIWLSSSVWPFPIHGVGSIKLPSVYIHVDGLSMLLFTYTYMIVLSAYTYKIEPSTFALHLYVYLCLMFSWSSTCMQLILCTDTQYMLDLIPLWSIMINTLKFYRFCK